MKAGSTVDEWTLAASRITQHSGAHGGREPAAMAWLLDFVQTPLDELSAGQRTDKEWEVSRFAFDAGLVMTLDNLQAKPMITEIGVNEMSTGHITAQILTRIQQTTRNAVENFIAQGEATFHNIAGSMTVSSPRHGTGQALRFSGEMESCFYFVTGQLLTRNGDRIRTCKGCGRLVLMARRDKEFCTQACQVADWKRKHLKKGGGRNPAKGGRHGKKGR